MDNMDQHSTSERLAGQALQCSIMRKTSVRELHIHTSELVREAADGGIIVIERRGEPVAELRPITSPLRMPADKKARIFASMRKIWARMPQVSDSTKIIEEDRSR
jgi:prevent-host-death family protein